MPTRTTAPTGAPCWIELSSEDSARARDFYTQLFGWTYEVSGEENPGYINCFLNGELVAGIMANAAETEHKAGWTTYFTSTDAQATADMADDSGGQSAEAPTEIGSLGTVATLVDPGGATVGVWQPQDHTGYRIMGEPGAPVWHELHTRHYRASVLFYEAVLGWRTSELSDTDEFRFTTAEFDGTELCGIFDATNTIDEDTPASWQIYFGVTNVDQTIAQAEGLGATVVEAAKDTPYGRQATLTDPIGVPFTIMTPADWN